MQESPLVEAGVDECVTAAQESPLLECPDMGRWNNMNLDTREAGFSNQQQSPPPQKSRVGAAPNQVGADRSLETPVFPSVLQTPKEDAAPGPQKRNEEDSLKTYVPGEGNERPESSQLRPDLATTDTEHDPKPNLLQQSDQKSAVHGNCECTDGAVSRTRSSVRKHVPQILLPPPGEFYVEETAYKYHNHPKPVQGKDIPDAIAPEDLPPLPPAPPIPKLPETGYCKWSWDEKSRVLLGNFVRKNGDVDVIEEDEKFLLSMMERDDVTVISEGIARSLNPYLWNLEHLASAVGDEYYHKFRRFDREEIKLKRSKIKSNQEHSDDTQPSVAHNGEMIASEARAHGDASQPRSGDAYAETEEANRSGDADYRDEEQAEDWISVVHKEKDACLSLKVSDFARYLKMRQKALERKRKSEHLDASMTAFKFVDHLEKDHEIDVTEVVLYMIDFDLVKLLPKLYEDLQNNFKLPGCLPGGAHCMMNAVSLSP